MRKNIYITTILYTTMAIYSSSQKTEAPTTSQQTPKPVFEAPKTPTPTPQQTPKTVYKSIIISQAGCVAGDMTIILPGNRDFTFICRKDYRGKGKVIVSADPITGNPVEVFVQTPSSNAAVSQQKFSDAIIELFTKNNLGSITKKTPLDIHFPTQATLLTGYAYKPTSDDLAGKNIYILVRYYNENNQEGIRFYRSLDRPGSKKDTRKSRALWTEFWSIEGVLSEENQKNTKITILPNGNCEINLPGWLPIVLPLGTKELTFKSQVKSPLKS